MSREEAATKAWVSRHAQPGSWTLEENLSAALAAADAWDAANGVYRVSLDDPKVLAALFKVESIHQIHENQCLCGFKSYVARARTHHIMWAALAAVKEGQ